MHTCNINKIQEDLVTNKIQEDLVTDKTRQWSDLGPIKIGVNNVPLDEVRSVAEEG